MTKEEMEAVSLASAAHFVAIYAGLIKRRLLTYAEAVDIMHVTTVPISGESDLGNQTRDIMSEFILQGLRPLSGQSQP